MGAAHSPSASITPVTANLFTKAGLTTEGFTGWVSWADLVDTPLRWRAASTPWSMSQIRTQHFSRPASPGSVERTTPQSA